MLKDRAHLQSADFALHKRADRTPLAVTELRRLAPRTDGPRVVVIGAGLAGLTISYELQRLGFDVQLLEADRRHVGGRVRTLRFDDGAYAEAGAMRIPAGHELTRYYAHELGLKLRPFVQNNDEAWVLVRGRKVRSRDLASISSLFNLAPSEQGEGPGEFWERAVATLVGSLTLEQVDDLYATSPQTELVRSLDRETLWSHLERSGLSAEAIQLLASGWNLETSLSVGLAEHLREAIEKTWDEAFDEIEGGMDRLPAALNAKLRQPARRGHRVTAVEQDGGGAVVHYTASGKAERLECDWVVCATPVEPARRIRFSPALSPRKREAMRRVSYDSATKIIARAKLRFWETDDGIYGGGSISDDLLGSTWYPSDNADGNAAKSAAPAAFLASYTWDQLARRMADGADLVKPALARLHDRVASDPDCITEVVVWSWDRFLLSRGAYALFGPGEHTHLWKELITAEGRLFFAGEHASLTHSWMQGAIESGLQTALAIASR